MAFVIVALFALLRIESRLTPADPQKSHPRQIILIRHAEKPPEELMRVDLTEQGTARAAALHKLFEKSADRPDPLTKPDFVIAGANTKKSERSVLTAAPLAKRFDLKVNATIEKNDYPRLAAELLSKPIYAGKTVLVVWNHSNLPGLAKALGADGVPEHWNPEVFDRVWTVTWDDKGKATFTDMPQRLLPGDSKK